MKLRTNKLVMTLILDYYYIKLFNLYDIAIAIATATEINSKNTLKLGLVYKVIIAQRVPFIWVPYLAN